MENEFLERDGVTREMMTNVLGISGISSASLLIKGEYMKTLGDKTYKLAYFFLEKLRILEEKGKSEHRLENENENLSGCHYYGGKDLIKRIEDVILTVDVVFDTYPQVVAKFISQFLKGRRRFEVEKRQVKNVDTSHEYRCIGKPMNTNQKSCWISV